MFVTLQYRFAWRASGAWSLNKRLDRGCITTVRLKSGIGGRQTFAPLSCRSFGSDPWTLLAAIKQWLSATRLEVRDY